MQSILQRFWSYIIQTDLYNWAGDICISYFKYLSGIESSLIMFTTLYDHFENSNIEIDVSICNFIKRLNIVIILCSYSLYWTLFIVCCLLVRFPAFLLQGCSSKKEIAFCFQGFTIVKSMRLDDCSSLNNLTWDPNEIIAKLLYIRCVRRISNTSKISSSSFLLWSFHIKACNFCQFR